MATVEQMVACDYVGIVSGNREPDKFAKAGFHATKSEFVNAPLIDELPMAVECEVLSYDPETCHLIDVCKRQALHLREQSPHELNLLVSITGRNSE